MLYSALKKQDFSPITFYPNTSDHAWWADGAHPALSLCAHHLQLGKNPSNTKVMHKGLGIKTALQQKGHTIFLFLYCLDRITLCCITPLCSIAHFISNVLFDLL